MNNTLPYQPNPNKKLVIEIDGKQFARYPIKTKIINKTDTIEDIIHSFVPIEKLLPDDILVIGHKAIAIPQGRAFHKNEVRITPLARFLVKFVYKPPWGVGIGDPVSMQLALNEAGIPRLLFAAFFSALTKPFGWRGVFYKIAGKGISGIDGPVADGLPGHQWEALLAPKDSDKVCQQISAITKIATVIIDANDIGSQIFGTSGTVDIPLIQKIFKDNPMGQSKEQTPLIVVRPIKH